LQEKFDSAVCCISFKHESFANSATTKNAPQDFPLENGGFDTFKQPEDIFEQFWQQNVELCSGVTKYQPSKITQHRGRVRCI